MRLRSDPHRWRWILWGGLALVFLLVNLFRLSSAVLAEDLMIAFETTGAQLGTLHASFFYIYALMQLPAGILADRAGPRRTATAGAIVLNVGAIGFALSEGYVLGFVTRGMIGLGGAVIFVSMLRFGASWFRDDEFATLNGLTIAIAGLGGILATTPLAVAAATLGWRTTIFGLGLVGLLITVFVYLNTADTPEEAGFTSSGAPAGPSLDLSAVLVNLRNVLRERETWIVSLMLFCSIGTVITLLGLWGVPYIVQVHEVSVTRASWYVLFGSVGLLIGPPAFGWLSDRLGRRSRLILIGGFGYVIGFGSLAVLGRPPLVMVGVIYFVLGFLLGSFTLAYPLIKERHPTAASGVSTATVNGAGFLGAAVFPTVLGLALDDYWLGETIGGVRIYTELGYQVSFTIASGASLVALACSVALYLLDTSK